MFSLLTPFAGGQSQQDADRGHLVALDEVVVDVQPGQVGQVTVQAEGHQKTGVLHRVLGAGLPRG